MFISLLTLYRVLYVEELLFIKLELSSIYIAHYHILENREVITLKSQLLILSIWAFKALSQGLVALIKELALNAHPTVRFRSLLQGNINHSLNQAFNDVH